MGYCSKIKRNELLTRQPGAPQNKYGGREEPDRRKRGDAIALFYLYKLRKCRLIWSDQLSAVTMGRSGLGTALGGGARRDAPATLAVATAHHASGVTGSYPSHTCSLLRVSSASVKKYVKSKHFAEQKNTKNTFSKW